MKSLKYRQKVRRNVPFQNEKLSIKNRKKQKKKEKIEKIDEKKQSFKYIISGSNKAC